MRTRLANDDFLFFFALNMYNAITLTFFKTFVTRSVVCVCVCMCVIVCVRCVRLYCMFIHVCATSEREGENVRKKWKCCKL